MAGRASFQCMWYWGKMWALLARPVCPIGAAGLALAGIALIAYFAGREKSRTKVLLLVGAGLLSAVLIVTGVELKLREEHDVVKSAAGTEVVCHHQ